MEEETVAGLSNSNNGSHTSVANVATSNRFEMLTHAPVDGDDNANTANCENNKSFSNKKIHCPPITVLRQDARQIRSLLKQENIPDDYYHMKGMKGGVLVITKQVETHKRIAELMKTNSLEFFTHQISSEAPLKVVLSGLHLMESDELMAELDLVGVKPSEVKTMSTSNEDVVPYLLYFANGTVKLQDLQNIRYVCNSVVRWRKFAKKNRKHRAMLPLPTL